MANVTYDEVKIIANNGYRNENSLPLGWKSADNHISIKPARFSSFKDYIYSKLQSDFGIQNPGAFLSDHEMDFSISYNQNENLAILALGGSDELYDYIPEEALSN